MKIAVDAELTDQTLPVPELAQLVESAGAEALFFMQCTHVPVASHTLTTSPDHAQDASFLDPLAALGAAAAVTSRLRLGTGALYAALYDPIILARALATLDHLMDGRLLVGVTPGYDDNRFRNHGIEPSRRFAALRETCLAVRALWTQQHAEFHGEFVDFGPVVLGLMPRQRPHPPILVGSHGANGLRRVVEYGDMWFPVMHSGLNLEADMAQLEQLCAEAGRQPVSVTVFMWEFDEASLQRCADAGVERCVIDFFPTDRGTVDNFLKRIAEVSRQFGG